MKAIIAAALGAILAVPAAHAQVFGTGQIYGGSAQSTATCYLFNTGNKAVTLSALSLFYGDGSHPTTNVGCPGTLAAGQGCSSTGSRLLTSSGLACAMQPVKSTTLRGSLEIRDSNGNILVAQPLR
jgi:hypothetical protein